MRSGMDQGYTGRTFFAACTIALGLGLGTAACGGERPSSESEAILPGADDRAASREGASVTLTGCLQKRDGTLTDSFILTEVNSPIADPPVATTGGTGAAVERERLRAAAHAYRLEGDDDQLEPNVGKRVEVTGRLEEASDLRTERTDRPASERPGVGTGGERERETVEIDPDDLAQVEVQSVRVVAEACGTR